MSSKSKGNLILYLCFLQINFWGSKEIEVTVQIFEEAKNYAIEILSEV